MARLRLHPEQLTTKSSDDDGQRSNKGLVEGDDYTIDD